MPETVVVDRESICSGKHARMVIPPRSVIPSMGDLHLSMSLIKCCVTSSKVHLVNTFTMT